MGLLRTTKDARHVGHGDAQRIAHGSREECAENDEPDGRGEQAQAVGPHRAEESGTDLQAQGVDEDDESETFGIGQHRGIEPQPEVSGEDAGEEDEGRAEGDAEEADLTQPDPDRGDQRNHHDGLQGRGFEKQVFEPFHQSIG